MIPVKMRLYPREYFDFDGAKSNLIIQEHVRRIEGSSGNNSLTYPECIDGELLCLGKKVIFTRDQSSSLSLIIPYI